MNRLQLLRTHLSPNPPSSMTLSSVSGSESKALADEPGRVSHKASERKSGTFRHFNDWPNHQGFDVMYEEREPIELRVKGKIPIYTAGTLFRTARSVSKMKTERGETYKVGHWFDGFSQVHRFQIVPPDEDHLSLRVIYNSRNSCDGLIEHVRKTGSQAGITFGRKYDPCMSIFQKLMTTFTPLRQDSNTKVDTVNLGVTVSASFPGLNPPLGAVPGGQSPIKTLCNKTDSNGYQLLDPQTLEPIGFTVQSSLHPELKGPMSATHAKSDPVTGDVYNYNLDFGRRSTYRVFRVSASTGKTSILATIPDADPAYIHSTLLTSNYVILCVWNCFFAHGGLKLLWERNIVDSVDYNDNKQAKWYVVDRRPREEGGFGLIATYDSKAFFCFHTVNAFETESLSDPGNVDIIADVLAYDNLDIMKRFYLDNVCSTSSTAAEFAGSRGDSSRPILMRFRLSSVPSSPTTEPTLQATVEFTIPRYTAPELPALNPHVITKPYRYVYGLVDSGKSTFYDSVAKVDIQTKTSKIWSVHAQSPGEPIFIPVPTIDGHPPNEDEGVLLTVVLDGEEGRSYLLCLDATTMEEVGRAEVPGVVGHGFHGTFVEQQPSSLGRLGRGVEY